MENGTGTSSRQGKFTNVDRQTEVKTMTLRSASTLFTRFSFYRLPYTEAVMHELLRITSVTSGGILHSTTENIRFEGYDLPKGTIILPNLYGCQHDEATWGDPYVFRPERWLNDDETQFVKDERSVPFSMGKRMCPAEHLVSVRLMNVYL